MPKPDQATRNNDQYKRQLTLLEFYLTGRIRQLERIAVKSPGDAPACEMAKSELSLVLTQVLPQMQEVQS